MEGLHPNDAPALNVGEWSLHHSRLLPAYQSYSYYSVKRTFDCLVAAALLIFLLPILLVIAIAVVINSSGPVLFIQQRVGSKRIYKDGKYFWVVQNFKIYKFRSMAADTDPLLHQQHIQSYISGNSKGLSENGLKPKGSMSITRVGRIIRKTSLDELPQLINVLKGDMSLVGPRPVPTYEVAEYRPQHFERFATLPGITGLWQVMGRCDTTFEEQMRLDSEYIHNQSLMLDIKILWLTIPAVIAGRGAA